MISLTNALCSITIADQSCGVAQEVMAPSRTEPVYSAVHKTMSAADVSLSQSCCDSCVLLCACSIAIADQSYGIAKETVAPVTGSAYSFLDEATPKAANSGPSTSLAGSISG